MQRAAWNGSNRALLRLDHAEDVNGPRGPVQDIGLVKPDNALCNVLTRRLRSGGTGVRDSPTELSASHIVRD